MATPNLVQLTQGLFAAAGQRDVDATMRFHAAGAVWDLSDGGLGIFEGAAAIRGFLEEWFQSFDENRFDVREIVELGTGLVFAHVQEMAQPAGVGGSIAQPRGWIVCWEDGRCARATAYHAVDQARAGAERLAEERG